jgi:hypothetical protein
MPAGLTATFITVVVVGPWLSPGYIFGTDWPGPRQFGLPTEVSSSYLIRATLAEASRLIGGEATSKVFVFGIVFAAAVTAYLAAPVGGFIPKATAAGIYVLSPFVYGRLHYGQLFLLAGFAILPWVAAQVRRLLHDPGLRSGMTAAASFVLLGIMSTHLFLIASAFAAVMAAAHLAWVLNKGEYLKRAGPPMLFAAGVSLVASSYWIVPILRGRGYEGTVIAEVGPGDLNAYAAVPDQALGLVPNLLGLYGFWAENTGRFTSMKAFVPYWPGVLGAIILLAAIGAVVTLRQNRSPLSPWVAGLLVAGGLGLFLEMGISQPLSAGLVRWLDANVVPYRGLRDAGKWAALLALVYSQLVPLGVVATLGWLGRRQRTSRVTDWRVGLVTGVLLALPIYYGNGLLYGMHGEIKPSSYPAGWYAADRVLASDSHPGRALFLPWHEYMNLSFVRNQNSVVYSPAPSFFSVQVLVSADPEVPGVASPRSPDQALVTGLIADGSQGAWADRLASIGVKYILVAREVNWVSYSYLDAQAGLVKLGDFGSVVLYRNKLVT